MARQLLPIAGAAVGAFFGGFAGAQAGFVAGTVVGSYVDPIIIQGNKIGDSQLQAAAEGGARAIVFGQACITSTCVIARGNRRVVKRDDGGKGNPPQVSNESVYWTFAIGLSEALVGKQILRVWQDETLTYDIRPDSQVSGDDNSNFAGKMRFYDGSETQLPDPDLQVFLGDDTPYFRGTAYVVFPNFDLTNTAERVPMFRFEVADATTGPTDIGLDTVVVALTARAGMSADELDVSELNDSVAGVVIQETMTGVDCIGSVLAPYFADPVEFDGKLHFIKRGKDILRTLIIDDIVEEPETSSRENAVEYPAKLHFFYQSPKTGYATTKATSNRYSRDIDSTGEGSVSAPVTFVDGNEPANIAAKLHKVMWNEAGGDFQWTVGDHCLDLVPSDCVGLSLRGVVTRARITGTDTQQGRIKLTMRKDRQSSYVSDVEPIVLPNPTPPQPSSMSLSVLAVMDIPALIDSDDLLCYYTAMSGKTQVWTGAQLQQSLDLGANWSSLSASTDNVPMGKLTASIAASSPHYPDRTNTVKFQLFDPRDQIDSLTNQQWLSENGAIAVQASGGSWELMQYRDAVEDTDGHYTLSVLQRGRLNTPAVAHPINSLVVVFSTSVQRQVIGSSRLGETLLHRAVSYGTSPEVADQVSTDFVGNSQLEWPVASFDAVVSGPDITVSSIVPRHRFGTEDVPIRSVNWNGYRVTCSDGAGSVSADGIAEPIIVDVSSLGTITAVTVRQINRITGPGLPLTQEPT